MFDVWIGEIELTAFVLLVSLVLLFPTQLLFCFKVRNPAIRLLPVIAFSISTAGFAILALAVPGWDGLGYVFLAVFSGFLLLGCGVGWGVWWIITRKTQNREAK